MQKSSYHGLASFLEYLIRILSSKSKFSSYFVCVLLFKGAQPSLPSFDDRKSFYADIDSSGADKMFVLLVLNFFAKESGCLNGLGIE